MVSPENPIITSNGNGEATLQRSGTPLNGDTWYWQGKDNSFGTSTTLGSGITFTANQGAGTYYIRARNSGGDWSNGSGSVYVTIAPVQANTLSDENYIHTTNYQNPFTATELSTATNNDKIESVTYFDGLGRPMQSVGIRAGGNNEDIITHVGYDNYGRQAKDYLPYAATSNGGLFRTGAETATLNYYDATKYDADFPGMTITDINPYSQKLFEASPLNRILEQTAPGSSWKVGTTFDTNGHSNGNSIKIGNQTNIATEVRRYEVSLAVSNVNNTRTYVPTLQNLTPYYAVNELYKTITKDENWKTADGTSHTTEEFKDKQRRVVLKRTYGASDLNGDGDTTDTGESNAQHDTYYVYDNFGNLTYVLPPKAEPHTALPDATKLAELCYQYKYDHRNRLVEKKLPGKGIATDWEEIVYNKLDQPILTRDPNLKAQSKWLFTKYDAFGRVAYTGLISSASSRTTEQNGANGTSLQYVTKSQTATTIAGTTIYYDNGAYPIVATTDEIQTINYYDDYNFDKGISMLPSPIYGKDVINYDDTNKPLTKGLATGSKIRILGTANWTTTLIGYDAKGRPIYNYSKNDYLATTSTVKSQLDFTGKTLETTSTHLKSSVTTTVVDAFTYDQTGRLTKQTQAINGTATPEVIVTNAYDELGQLTSKGVGGKTTQSRLQNVDYTYNIRGWLKEINDVNAIGNDLFSFKLSYNEATAPKPLFNGNISQSFWKTANNSDSSLKNYNYAYDALNRLTDAADNQSRYAERLTYDLNGNINTLKRDGNQILGTGNYGPIDDLRYEYLSGNRLNKVSDATGNTEGFKDVASSIDYDYDDNGNMTSDTNKGITNIDYNHLNLPVTIQMTGGTITYDYDATGMKLRKTVSGNTTDYADGFQYLNGELQFFPHPEGYVDWNNGNIDYIYQYKDHLGNIRLAYKDGNKDGAVNSGDILSEDNYYPFGLRQRGYNETVVNSNNKYKYNGKELQDELGLNMYDYGARNYDPAIGRWMNVDPKAETSKRFSPYTYALNNPVRFVDPDGMEATDWYKDKKGITRFDSSVKNQADVEKISPGGKYIASEFNTKTANYYKDGSAFFKNESEGYKFMIDNSYMQQGAKETELVGYIAKTGVAVLPKEGKDMWGNNFENTSLHSELNVKGALWMGTGKDLTVNFHGKTLNPIAWIHTHPDTFGGFGQSAGDTGVTRTLGVPSIIIGRNSIWAQSVNDAKNNIGGGEVMTRSQLENENYGSVTSDNNFLSLGLLKHSIHEYQRSLLSKIYYSSSGIFQA